MRPGFADDAGLGVEDGGPAGIGAVKNDLTLLHAPDLRQALGQPGCSSDGSPAGADALEHFVAQVNAGERGRVNRSAGPHVRRRLNFLAVATVFATAEVVKLSPERLLELLAALRPTVYGVWTPDALVAGLRPHGITSKQVLTDEGNLSLPLASGGRPEVHKHNVYRLRGVTVTDEERRSAEERLAAFRERARQRADAAAVPRVVLRCHVRARYSALKDARAAVALAGTGDHIFFCRRCCGWHTEPSLLG